MLDESRSRRISDDMRSNEMGRRGIGRHRRRLLRASSAAADERGEKQSTEQPAEQSGHVATSLWRKSLHSSCLTNGKRPLYGALFRFKSLSEELITQVDVKSFQPPTAAYTTSQHP